MIRKTLLAGFALLFISIASITFWAAGHSDVADAAMKGDKAALRTLIQQKADVNATQVDGATALHWAVYRLDVEAVDLLLKAGAKADVKNREGVTPLHLASEYGDAKIIDRLIKAGADPKQRGPCGLSNRSILKLSLLSWMVKPTSPPDPAAQACHGTTWRTA
jgi:ankyrin repeat protein